MQVRRMVCTFSWDQSLPGSENHDWGELTPLRMKVANAPNLKEFSDLGPWKQRGIDSLWKKNEQANEQLI